MTDRDREFLEKARFVLDESVDGLDGVTRAGLARARNAALDTAGRGRARRRRQWLAWGTPAVGLAAALLVGLFLFNGTTPPTAGEYVTDLDILTSGESLDFYEEMEFLEWLAEEAAHDEVSRGGNYYRPAGYHARSRGGWHRKSGRSGHGYAGVSGRV
ncbi:hypothetical protein GM415_05770 [Pseudodesulfovibrio cashew]|uniref:DUF3619 family protein n=1 Tax=Pseudodesulfovibrio cashew TaxID=2678688 RepID=A0A6I6JGK0_9BACT|nr:hypothetical protein [Pseudodesulfovibrio cashew]QGY39643.1 hypothetical protein GM415_05770 [Pseudodesulfovibrio cashew]